MRLGSRQDVEREGQQPVACQDRGRFVERLVGGGLAAAQVVIVHRRQVVVHQRIAVHAFERRTDHQSAFAGDVKQRGGARHQKRPQPLAPAEARVAHGVEQALGARALAVDRIGREQPVEQGFDIRCNRGELRLKTPSGQRHSSLLEGGLKSTSGNRPGRTI